MKSDLLKWFDAKRRDLPWRQTRDPYAIWLSEVMLQQTQVDTVIPYWHRFLETFPTLLALAEAPLEQVLSRWRGLGYYSRARNLHRAAQEMVAHHGANLPRTAQELFELPGFGRYTAGAVASIAFGEAAPLVDGNVARVFSRLFLVEGPPGDREREKRLWQLAEQWVAGERPGDWNQALMELGALICRSDSPLCLLCPVQAHCGALAAGRVRELPPPKIRSPRKPLALAVAVWAQHGKLLLARRGGTGLFGGLWELPSAEIDPRLVDAESLAEAVRTGLQRACGVQIEVGEPLGVVERVLTHRDLKLHLYRVEGRGPARASEPYLEMRWTDAGEAAELGMSTAMHHAWKAATGHPHDRPVANRSKRHLSSRLL